MGPWDNNTVFNRFLKIKKNQVKILTPLLVYIFIRATRWDHSQSSRIEKTMIFTKNNIFYMKKYEKIAEKRFFFFNREKYQKCPKMEFRG